MAERIAPQCGCVTTGKIVRGMCARHYDRWVQTTPKDRRPTPPRFSRSFDDYVAAPDDRGCTAWMGPRNRKGYGLWSDTANGERGLAHRINLVRAVGEPPEPRMACHHCDNPSCVNPDHLYWGTVINNTRDAVERGRNHVPPLSTECPQGHPMSGDNLRVYSGKRFCRTCMNDRAREYQRRKRQERTRGSR